MFKQVAGIFFSSVLFYALISLYNYLSNILCDYEIVRRNKPMPVHCRAPFCNGDDFYVYQPNPNFEKDYHESIKKNEEPVKNKTEKSFGELLINSVEEESFSETSADNEVE
jgi:hypothetical protein